MSEETLGYVTLTEANTYIAEHYLSTDKLRVLWNALSNNDKSALLRKAFQLIEMLPFTGRKYSFNQTTAWPRCPWGEEVPNDIKYAQIEQGLTGADTSTDEEAKQYAKMWSWGVSSYSIGNLSERLSEGGYNPYGAQATGITSTAAQKLLQKYMQGSYRIL